MAERVARQFELRGQGKTGCATVIREGVAQVGQMPVRRRSPGRFSWLGRSSSSIGARAAVILGPAAMVWMFAAVQPAESQLRPASRQGQTAVVDRARVSVADGVTRLRLSLTARRLPKVATLAAPYRMIADFPAALFHLGPGVGRSGRGLISAFRFGLMTPGVSRLVVDLNGAFSIRAMRIVGNGADRTDLVFEIVPVRPERFARQGRQPAEPVKAALRQGQFDHAKQKGKHHPVIVIDPGHGGPDPGAIGRSNTYEKTIALAVSRRLAARLRADNRYKVLMTRTRDIFVSLDDRVELSRKVGASLFLSLHADATVAGAETVRGASIYTLSRRASNAQAHRLAQKENAADVLAGLAVVRSDTGHAVENILIDLLNRETRVFSHRAQDAIIRAFRGKVILSGDPQRSAAFKVLKQTGVPSVLIELGYISHARDERKMRNPDWQGKAADAIADAVAEYFATTRSVMR